jgi:hypothetical protein
VHGSAAESGAINNRSKKARKIVKTYKVAGVTLEFPDNLFEQLDREAAEHVIKSYLKENDTYQGYSDIDHKACVEGFLDLIKPRGSCWSIV